MKSGRSSPFGSFLVNVLLLAVSTAVTLLVLEIGIRLVLDEDKIASLPYAFVNESTQRQMRWTKRQLARSDSDRYGFDEHDPVLGWRLKANVSARSVKEGSYDVSVSSDANGLRSFSSNAKQDPGDVTRIGVFGCSQTFGEGVNDDETFSARLQTILPGSQVLNFGVHGYGTDQMLLKLEKQGQAYDLDVVVLAFAWFHLERNVNDFHFFAKPRFDLQTDGQLQLRNTPVPAPEELVKAAASRSDKRLVDHSVLLRWMWQRYRNLQISGLYKDNSEAWKLTKALVTRFVDTARQNGSRVLLLSIDESHPEMDALLEALADDVGAGFLNIGQLLSAADTDGQQYRLQNDAHWNSAGHEAVAREIARFLCQKKNSQGACDIRSALP